MRRRLAGAWLASVLGLTLGTGCRLQPEGAELAQTEPAPPFSLVDHRGQTVELAKLLGNGPVIVVFYRGFW